MIGLSGMAAGAWWGFRGRTRMGATVFGLSLAWLWVLSSPWFLLIFEGALERQYPPVSVKTLPVADVIVVLGGGIGSPTRQTVYPELYPGADRGWHAARCYLAGKAPVILFSGASEGPGMKQFLVDLGVPPAKIILESESKNTYENSLFTREQLKARKAKRVILVTSAWHMRRSVMTFRKMGVEVIPAGTDYEALSLSDEVTSRTLPYYLPNADVLGKNSDMLKEHLGYWAYWLYFRVDEMRTRAPHK